jgi:predicted methyltransferase
MQAERDAALARNAELDGKITEANRRAEQVRRDAERRIDEALNIDGYAGCTATERVSDGLRDDLSAYRSRHGDAVR